MFRISSRRVFALDNNGNAGIMKYGGNIEEGGIMTKLDNAGHKRVCYGHFLLNDTMLFIIGGQSVVGTANLSCQYFDLSEMVWKKIADLNTKKTFFPAVFPS